jgi:hypothetical protein
MEVREFPERQEPWSFLGDRSIYDGGDCAVVAQLATLCVYRAVDIGVCNVCVTEFCDSVVGSFTDTVEKLASWFCDQKWWRGRVCVRVVNESVFKLQGEVVHALVSALFEVEA